MNPALALALAYVAWRIWMSNAPQQLVGPFTPAAVPAKLDLHPEFRALVEQWVEAVARAGLSIKIIEGRRSAARQAELQRKGASQLTDGPHMHGVAIDFAFVLADGSLSWDARLPWKIAGELAEQLGMKWGGRWTTLVDLGHIEMKNWRQYRQAVS